jgi:Lipoprotein LpqB beta-propeller domain/Sporulation and spore germination
MRMNTRRLSRLPLRRTRIAAIAVLVALALAGCVGIPSGGSVSIGPAVQNGSDSSFADLPSRPPKDASKDVILADFMQAAKLPEGDYANARLFLTAKAAQAWDPTKSVLIREGSATTTDGVDGSLSYTVTTKAAIDADGTYLEQSSVATQSLSYGFQKVNGQWRISSLANGTVLPRSSFPQVFGEYPVYFFDPQYHYLVPDVRWFPIGATADTRIVSALLAGPAEWLQQGVVVTAFPQGVQIGQAVTVRGAAATVDLSAGAANTKAIDRARMLQQLELSLQATGITAVSMTARGAPLTTQPGLSRVQVATTVNGAPLIQKGKQFGFYPKLDPLGKLSDQVVSLNGSGASVDREQTSAAVLAKGGVYLVTENGSAPKLVDGRPGLITPSIDPNGYVWSVPSSDASAIQVTGATGGPHAVASGIPSHSVVVSLEVSHDGTRVLIYLKTTSGPLLVVAGIIRRNGVPTSLGELLDLPVSSADPVDATWVDSSTIAALGVQSGEDTVVSYVIGGTSGDPSTTTDGSHLVAGSDLRLITTDGEVQRLASSGWQDINVVASMLATQQ